MHNKTWTQGITEWEQQLTMNHQKSNLPLRALSDCSISNGVGT